MSNEQIRALLEQLKAEIQKTELDDDARALVRQLDTDIHNLLADDKSASDAGTVLGRAKELEASF